MTRKERQALVLKRFRFEVVSDLISPASDMRCITKEVKLEEHDIDSVIEVAERMRHISLKRSEVVTAISDHYLTVIKPANSYIISFRFANTSENGKNILRVFATIRINLKSEQSDSLILGTKVPLRSATTEEFIRAQSGGLFNPLSG